MEADEVDGGGRGGWRRTRWKVDLGRMEGEGGERRERRTGVASSVECQRGERELALLVAASHRMTGPVREVSKTVAYCAVDRATQGHVLVPDRRYGEPLVVVRPTGESPNER
ncbi:hypothetical protein [Halomicrococcus gelatinilyticus]|uniref:hypothetical protein n=1 Tax=Halomicrococcus gelatinilyticus TaxID=1702103 RepID=UPI002E0FFAF9